MLDNDLAELYGVTTARLNESVKRNKSRFPETFMFKLTKKEYDSLRSQIAISKTKGGRRYLPNVFTEYGTVMLSSILKSERAIKVNIQVVEAFIKMREFAANQNQIVKKLNQLEKKFIKHDEKIEQIFMAIKELFGYQKKDKQKKIGFE
jgi:hypothetical protein